MPPPTLARYRAARVFTEYAYQLLHRAQDSGFRLPEQELDAMEFNLQEQKERFEAAEDDVPDAEAWIVDEIIASTQILLEEIDDYRSQDQKEANVK